VLLHLPSPTVTCPLPKGIRREDKSLLTDTESLRQVHQAVALIASPRAAPPALPGIFHSLEPLLKSYGYLAVFALVFVEDLGVPVPGETILIAAAVYAGAGRLNIIVAFLLGLVAAVLGDNLGYVIGRKAGRAAVLRWGSTCCSPPSGSTPPKGSSPGTAAKSSPSPASSPACAKPTGSSPD